MASGQANGESRGWVNWAGDQSCHPAEVVRPASRDELGEAIAAAAAAGADYVTLSPIYLTDSKPGYGPALGIEALRAAAGHGIPVLALGGITVATAAACVAAGADGVAVMGEVMRADDPARIVRDLVEALRSGRKAGSGFSIGERCR